MHQINEFIFLPGVLEGLSLLRDAGYLLIVVTNQAGIAHGYFNIKDLDQLHEYMSTHLANNGIKLDAIYYCPHHPQGRVHQFALDCDCRKPAPGMLIQASLDFDLDLESSVMIGDKLSDIEAGFRAGVGRTVIVESGHKFEHNAVIKASIISSDLLSAARAITGDCNLHTRYL